MPLSTLVRTGSKGGLFEMPPSLSTVLLRRVEGLPNPKSYGGLSDRRNTPELTKSETRSDYRAGEHDTMKVCIEPQLRSKGVEQYCVSECCFMKELLLRVSLHTMLTDNWLRNSAPTRAVSSLWG